MKKKADILNSNASANGKNGKPTAPSAVDGREDLSPSCPVGPVLNGAQTALTVEQFLLSKAQYGERSGFKPLWMPSFLFDFQGATTEWNCEMGRSATFADCGMGKTPMEQVWAQNVVQKTNKPVLNLTALAVAAQTMGEAEKFGIDAIRSNDGKISGARIHVTNYEKLHYFNPNDFGGVVCDESSCIKAFNGKRRAQVTEFLRTIPYRLMATATAAPNDYIELGTTSEALGVMGQMDMLNRFFKNDANTSDMRRIIRQSPAQGGPKSAGWRFKGHAETAFWRFVCGFARAGRKPSDFGPFSDKRFHLPDLIEREHIVETRTLADGALFPLPATNMHEERDERRRTIEERCEKAADLVYGTKKPAVVWCHLNDEGDLLEQLILGGKQISGASSDEEKEETFAAFSRGELRVLIIKPKIGAWGLNWQHCAHVVTFASHSYEQYYQAVRRCWRFGQKSPVTVDIIATEGEIGAKENMKRKSEQADRMFALLVKHMHEALKIDRSNFENAVEVPAWL